MSVGPSIRCPERNGMAWEKNVVGENKKERTWESSCRYVWMQEEMFGKQSPITEEESMRLANDQGRSDLYSNWSLWCS